MVQSSNTPSNHDKREALKQSIRKYCQERNLNVVVFSLKGEILEICQAAEPDLKEGDTLTYIQVNDSFSFGMKM